MKFGIKRNVDPEQAEKIRKIKDARALHIIICSLAILACNCYYLYMDVDYLPAIDGICSYIGIVIWDVTAIGAIICRKDLRRAVLLLSIGISADYLLESLSVDITEDFYFFQYVIADVIAVMMAFCTVSLYKGFRHNVTRLIILSGATILIYLIPWIIIKYVTKDLLEARHMLYYLVPSVISIGMYMSVLARPDVRDVSPSEELKSRLVRVESIQTMNWKNYLTPHEADILLGKCDEGWITHADGPVEKECVLYFKGQTKREWCITVRKWRGEDFLRAVLSPEKDSTGSWGLRFDIVYSCVRKQKGKDMLRIYGHEGFFMDIYLENPNIDKESKVSDTLDKLIVEF